MSNKTSVLITANIYAEMTNGQSKLRRLRKQSAVPMEQTALAGVVISDQMN